MKKDEKYKFERVEYRNIVWFYRKRRNEIEKKKTNEDKNEDKDKK